MLLLLFLCLHAAFNNSICISGRYICPCPHNYKKICYFFCNIFNLSSSAGCQQHGGSVCGWKTCGGGAWNHCAAGEKIVQYFINVVFLFVNTVNL